MEETSIHKRNKADNGDAKTADHVVYNNAAFEEDGPNGEVLPTTRNGHDDREIYDRANDEDHESNGCSRAVARVQQSISSFVKSYSHVMWIIFYIVLVMAYFAYFSYAMYYRFGDEGSWRLMVITVVFSVGLTVNLLLNRFRLISEANFNFNECFRRLDKIITKIRLAVVLPVLLAIGIGIYIIVDIAIDKPRNLVSLGGLVFFIASMFVFSHNPSKVNWRPVYWGVAL
jgi:hypothetical protein